MANITEPEVYMKRIADILGDEFVDGKLQPALDVSSVDEANLQTEKIDQQQEQLKQIKEEVEQNMYYIDDGYKAAADNVKPQKQSYWRGFFSGLFGRRDKDIEQQKQGLVHGEEIAQKPYNDIRLTIDDLVTQLEDAKQTLTKYINENK